MRRQTGQKQAAIEEKTMYMLEINYFLLLSLYTYHSEMNCHYLSVTEDNRWQNKSGHLIKSF